VPDAAPRVDHLLDRLSREGDPGLLVKGRVGLEKESLRVARSGGIATTPHPAALGSALTHPWITTDYSEALLEFVTPPFEEFSEALRCLRGLHRYVHERLGEEILWATSMPCILAGEKSIPIARYGSSNLGRMKHVYRVGLGYRYGRVMQVIAGVHFNFSLHEAFWPMYRDLLGGEELRAFRDAHYMGMVRNLQRYGWLIPYLFGASPAVCKSFFTDKEPDLLVFDDTTYYEPFATSLRMGDIGYQNRKEEGMGVKACYDSLHDYVHSLACATMTPCPVWERIGVKVEGEYRQLNANQLQIENEYYSSVRPKEIPQGMETPSRALLERGIRYVELRSLDVNAYHPLGIDEDQVRFLHLFMLYCLLRNSSLIDAEERREIDRNLLWVAHRGAGSPAQAPARGQGGALPGVGAGAAGGHGAPGGAGGGAERQPGLPGDAARTARQGGRRRAHPLGPHAAGDARAGRGLLRVRPPPVAGAVALLRERGTRRGVPARAGPVGRGIPGAAAAARGGERRAVRPLS
jgi:glutamate--cysteine ligase